eukprot:COSAG01_NODE_1192_length_11309_cov_8.575609_17_plen_141_part_00
MQRRLRHWHANGGRSHLNQCPASSSARRAFSILGCPFRLRFYLCHTCSCHEILRMETPGQAPPPRARPWQPSVGERVTLDSAVAAGALAGGGGVTAGGGALPCVVTAVDGGRVCVVFEVSCSCARIGSPCLRHCGHGAPM